MILNESGVGLIRAFSQTKRRGAAILARACVFAACLIWIGSPAVAPAAEGGSVQALVSITPASPTGLGNCIPFGQNTMFGFQGFIYRDVAAFSLVAGDRIRFDLGNLNNVDVRRNIYIAQANVNPVAGGASQSVRALSWIQIVSETQIPQNPLGNTVIGDYELAYIAETDFSFAGGGLIIAFGGTPPGTYTDTNCDPVGVSTTAADASGKFHRRFFNQPNLSLAALDDIASRSDSLSLSGFIIDREVDAVAVITAADDAYSVDEDTTLNVPAAGVLANDSATHQHNGLSAVLVSAPAHGTLALAADGSFTYTPSANYHGLDSFTYKATDGSVESEVATVNLAIVSVNDAPVAANDAYSVDEDSTLNVAATGVLANDSDVENDGLSAVLLSGPAHGTLTLNADGSFSYTPAANYNGTDSFSYKANDGTLNSEVATVSVTIIAVNDAPQITANNSVLSINEGGAAANSGSWNDVDSSETVAITVTDENANPIGAVSVAGQNWFWNYTGVDDFAGVLTVTATDSASATSSTTFNLTVNNVAPTAVFTSPLQGIVQAMDTEITFTAAINDPGADTHTGEFRFESPGMEPLIVPAQTSGQTATAELALLEPGVYTASLTVTDDDGGSGTTQLENFVVIYDPSGGFVIGGGWINSPAGAFVSDPTLTGKANFGFVAKYKKGATVPDGNTEFQFKAGNLNFSSASYEWLVVSGAHAQFKGRGTINGSGEYDFKLTAVDGQLQGGADKFRIKIWNTGNGTVAYDNVAESEIGGGSIVIHQQ